jgi:hypothetical protein
VVAGLGNEGVVYGLVRMVSSTTSLFAIVLALLLGGLQTDDHSTHWDGGVDAVEGLHLASSSNYGPGRHDPLDAYRICYMASRLT